MQFENNISKLILLSTFTLILYSQYIAVSSFELLPYVQIDYVHYIRLAQCQAKCAEIVSYLSKIFFLYNIYFILVWIS